MAVRSTLVLSASVFAFVAGAAHAQDADTPDAQQGGIQEIVVTAQKRSESVNDVGMSISALSSDVLEQRNITVPSELTKVVTGLTFTEAPRGAPVFAIRGIGFDDSTLGSASTVALYGDEVPYNYPVEARMAAIDLQRVEVLKGPQGILFGQNSTAGAINFIANKPTDYFSGGFDLTYGRFNQLDAGGFVSGPLSDTLNVRIAYKFSHMEEWQKSYTRDDKLGEKLVYGGRFIAEWTPVEPLTVTATVDGWIDKSDTQAAQLQYALPLLPVSQAANPGWVYPDYPAAPDNARAADWDANPDFPLKRDDSYIRGSLRLDYELSLDLTLTSITSYSEYRQDFAMDLDGSALESLTLGDQGAVDAFNQELRLTGDLGALKFIVGANYSDQDVSQVNQYRLQDSSVFYGFLGNTSAGANFDEPIETYAVFANVDYEISDLITLHGGLRYTKDKRVYTGCTRDAGDGVQGGIFNIIYPLFNPPGAPFTPIENGGCTSSAVVSDPSLVTATNPNGEYFLPGLAEYPLSEDNVSWRVGVDFNVNPDTLVYANVSRGYKSGSFPAVNVVNNIQLEGVTQESVLAYELGVKASLLDNRIQFNAAGFYNDYTDKQLRGRILDPFGFFGILDKLLNVPKSEVYGGEVSIQAVPSDGLTLNAAATYTKSKVTDDFFAYDPVGNYINYNGLSFPHTPEWNLSGSIDYETPVTASLDAFAGVSASYRSKTIGLFADRDLLPQTLLDPTNDPNSYVPRDAFDEKAYTVVDAQFGIADSGGAWRAWIWGKNIFNEYYWTNATQSFDSIYRLAAMPATYGVSTSIRF